MSDKYGRNCFERIKNWYLVSFKWKQLKLPRLLKKSGGHILFAMWIFFKYKIDNLFVKHVFL